jgi:5'-nucleotidase
VLTQHVTIENRFTGTAVEGRPADCVKLAVAKLVPRTPDLVVSGINSGANTGINVIYSGTVAAAIEAAFLGLPSIAMSLYLRRDVQPDYAHAAVYARQTIELILEAGLPPGRCATVNLPAMGKDGVPTGVRVVRQCDRGWADAYEERKDPRGRSYFWNSSVFTLGDTAEDTDVAALRDGYVTVTPLQFDLTHYQQLREWQGKEWVIGAD